MEIELLKHPANFKWHLRGIGREIGVGTQPATL